MRQHQERLIVFALAQLGDVVADLLTYAFDVIKHADFATDELHDPDRQRIGSRRSAAKIKERLTRLQWRQNIPTSLDC